MTKKRITNKFGPRIQCTEKPFGYRVIDHGYSLMSCHDMYSCLWQNIGFKDTKETPFVLFIKEKSFNKINIIFSRFFIIKKRDV